MPSKRSLDLSVRESRPGGPWGHKYVLRVSLSEDMLVWDVKTKVLELKPGYDPAGTRLYYLGVPMANCRSLKDYHVASMGTLHIMRGGQGCVEAGKSCICATQLQHVLEKKRKVDVAREEAEQKEQAEKLQLLVSASSREASLNRVLFLQVESALLLASSRSVHNTKAAVAAVSIAEQMIKMGADPAVLTESYLNRASSLSTDHHRQVATNESAQQLMKRLASVLYPRFRKWPPLVVKLAELVGVKPPRRREEE